MSFPLAGGQLLLDRGKLPANFGNDVTGLDLSLFGQQANQMRQLRNALGLLFAGQSSSRSSQELGKCLGPYGMSP